jgi:hypothetical protein
LLRALDGRTDEGIAQALGVSNSTAKRLFCAIYEKVAGDIPDLQLSRISLSPGTRCKEQYEMTRFATSWTLGLYITGAILAGCGGVSQLNATSTLGTQRLPHDSSGSQTFYYTGAKQLFSVPTGVRQLTIEAAGASGKSGTSGAGAGGLGGLVTATISVTPGESLAIFVGGKGNRERGGFNGGGDAGRRLAYGGGGASDVRQGGDNLGDRVVVAGGGGGGGNNGTFGLPGGYGGPGGGRIGGAAGFGSGSEGGGGGGGTGGTQNAGGTGGAAGPGGGGSLNCTGRAGANGMIKLGGNGADAVCGNESGAGGGGGGGYYGGGGGGSGGNGGTGEGYSAGAGGGGGGGSSFIERGAVNVKNVRGGAQRGNGQVVVSW